MGTLGKRIKEARGNITQQELAIQIGIAQNSLSRYERNEKTPDANFLIGFCEKLDISPNWLLFGVGEKTRSIGSSPQTGQGTLEKRLEASEEERRELAIENRKLWKENAELREKCARLEERMDKPLVSRGSSEMGKLG